jgi:hypothetical protein
VRFPRIALAALVVALAGAAAPAALACPAATYAYAGVAGTTAVSGVGATVTPGAGGFDILAGHVAGWVGVGGPGEGPGGSDEWLQVGLSSFPLWNGHDVYYELALPGMKPTYHRVSSSLPSGSPVRVAVLEMHNRPGWWRVWVNRAPASAPIHLPGSHHRWRPVVTAESWDGGSSACNAFLYSFDGIRIATRPGGLWSPLAQAQSLDIGGTRVIRASGRVEAAGGDLGLRALASASASLR